MLHLLLALAACHERPPATGPELADPAAPASAPAPDPAPEIPASRRCGEAGDAPTELPPELAAGRTPAGEGVVRLDESLTLGKVVLRYERSTWVGTMRAGHHAPALSILVERAEVGDGAWGAQVPIYSGLVQRNVVGPFWIDVRAATGDPPGELTIRVSRDICPATATIAAAATPRWFWVSSEGIRQHTYDLEGALLQVILDTSGATPRLDVSQLVYRLSLEPRPGPPRTIRAGRNLVTLERVVTGPGETSPKGAGEPAPRGAQVHVLVRVEPAPVNSTPAPTPARDPCGAASPERTTLPAALATLPAPAERRTLNPGPEVTLGPLKLEYRIVELPGVGQGPYREEPQQIPNLLVTASPIDSIPISGPYQGSRLGRLERDVVRVDPAPKIGAPWQIEVRRIPFTCPKMQTIPRLDAPTFLWLSTLGHQTVSLGEPGPGALALTLHLDPREPTLGVSTERSHLVRALGSDLAGLAFTLDGYRVDIVDVVAAADMRPEGTRWQTGDLVPALHVQLRVARE